MEGGMEGERIGGYEWRVRRESVRGRQGKECRQVGWRKRA